MPANKASGWQRIYNTVKRIPRGRVVTYGQLARLLKVPGGARTVGFAMAGTPSGQGIPWHRVVGEGGKLLPREPYASKQRMLLETEGTQFAGMRVDMHTHQWTFQKTRSAASNRNSGRGSRANSRKRHRL